MKDKRTIKIEALDPIGEPTGESAEVTYYNIGYATPPEEHPNYGKQGWEPMKKVRYLLTIGEHKYLMNRDGNIVERLKRTYMDDDNEIYERKPEKIEPIIETLKQVQVYQTDKVCTKCQEGNFIANGESFTTSYKAYMHVCDNCRETAMFTEKYPKIEYKPITK